MADEIQDAGSILTSIWQQSSEALDELDEECGPTKSCRNMKDVTFDGFAEDGVDLATAWRQKLAREGKLGASSLGDLVRDAAQ